MTDSTSTSSRLAAAGSARGAMLAALVIALLMALDGASQQWLRNLVFDGYQRLLPRNRASAPAVVVEIDERSLARFGQWPWPRTRIAQLLDRIAETGPAAVGVDLLFPEPDRLSPRRIVESMPDLEPKLAGGIRALPDNDEILAAALAQRPIVLGAAGDNATPAPDAKRPIRAIPVLVRGDATGLAAVPSYSGVIRSRPEMEAAAAGQGLINSSGDSGATVRRVPLLGRIGEQVMPNLEMAMLGVAAGVPALGITAGKNGVHTVDIGGLQVPTDPSGEMWLRFGERDIAKDSPRLVSAADVLLRRIKPGLLAHKLVLVATTGLALVDQPMTPVGRMPGAEVRAQLLENVFDSSWLTRPRWALWLEVALFLALATACGLRVPAVEPRAAFLEFGVAAAVLVLGGMVAFNFGLLVDIAAPVVGAALVFTLVLGGTLAQSRAQRRDLAQHLAAEREASARLAGELETARRVQMGMLPESPGVLAGDRRVDLKAFMEPARSVGGDLYDFFMLDERRLFVTIGDVSGKGLAAAMFMSLIKSLCKSAVLRQPQALDAALAQAEDEIKRENPESLFVTLLVLSLDLETGEFIYCNAGHDPLYSLLPGQAGPFKLDHGGRPPLCVLDDYPYPLGRDKLMPGQVLCMITDGITEAADTQGRLYGHKRLEEVLDRMRTATPAGLVEAVRKDVIEFASGADQSDDMSVLALRWNGPAPPAG